MKKALKMPLEFFKEVFEIDESCPSGLKRKERPRRHFKSEAMWLNYNANYSGKPAGGVKGEKYGFPRFLVHSKGKDWQASRIIWAIANNRDPGQLFVDHIDGNTLNNRISNLRVADSSESLFNRSCQRGNVSGYPGVFLYKGVGPWVARIRVKGIEIKLGKFIHLHEAIDARKLAEEKYCGEFGYATSRSLI